MSCIQITAPQPCCIYTILKQLSSDSSARIVSSSQCLQFRKAYINLTAGSSSYLGLKIQPKPWKLAHIASGRKQSTPVCLFGSKGKGKSEKEAEGSPWKGLEKAMSNFKKEPSVEDVLWQQIQNREYYDEDSSRKNTGGGGGSDGKSFTPDQLEEIRQVILATIGIIFLYMLIVEGEQMIAYGRDIIKFLLTGRKSMRLTRLIDYWARFFEEILAISSKLVRRRFPNPVLYQKLHFGFPSDSFI